MRRTTRRSCDRNTPALTNLGQKALRQVTAGSGLFEKSPGSTEETHPPRVIF